MLRVAGGSSLGWPGGGGSAKGRTLSMPGWRTRKLLYKNCAGKSKQKADCHRIKGNHPQWGGDAGRQKGRQAGWEAGLFGMLVS